MTDPLILDAGALLALRKRSSVVWEHLDRAQRGNVPVLIPAGALAQTVRGTPMDHDVDHVLGRDSTGVAVHDEQRARTAGGLLAKTGLSDAIDALVVAEAVRYPGATILTTDPDDIATLAQFNPRVRVVKV